MTHDLNKTDTSQRRPELTYNILTGHKPTQAINMMSIHTANSSININTTPTKSTRIVVKSKSYEELPKAPMSIDIETVPFTDRDSTHLEGNKVLEIQGDKIKMKVWGQKLHKLALKLENPQEEERLKKKIEKYIQKAPSNFFEGNDDKMELKRHLPEHIINKLKKIYLKPSKPEEDIDPGSREMRVAPKYYSRCKTEMLESVLVNWLKLLTIKNRDFLGRTMKKENILKYIADKIEPIVLDRVKSDSEYKEYLTANVTDIVNNLPIAFGIQNKEYYLSNLVDTLVNEIFSIDGKIPVSYIQPTGLEIKQFVTNEIIYFLEKSRQAISTTGMEFLETELSDIFLKLTDSDEVNTKIVDDITNIFQDIANLPEDKAKYFTKIMLNDFKEFFFRQNYLTDKTNNKLVRRDQSLVLHNKMDSIFLTNAYNLEIYTQELIREIDTWFISKKIQIKDRNFQEIVIKNLAHDIVDRHRYLEINPNSKGTVAEELEYLKYQIFKRTSKLVGMQNSNTMAHAKELMSRINLIPLPSTFNVRNDQPESKQKICSRNSTVYVENITDIIYNWFHQLPIDDHSIEDTCFNRKVMKSLAENIDKNITKKQVNAVEKEIDEWVVKMFSKKFSKSYVQLLKDQIIPYVETITKSQDPKQEKTIKMYESIINKWIKIVPSESKMEQKMFFKIKNKFVNKLASKLYNSDIKLDQLTTDNISKIIQEEISLWMKKVISKQKVEVNKSCNDVYSENISTESTYSGGESFIAKLETALFDWLKTLPSHRARKEVAVNNDSDGLRNMLLHNVSEDNSLEANVEDWLSKLPIHIKASEYFEIKKITFIENIRLLRAFGANDTTIIKEIIKFMTTLPIELISRLDDRYLDRQTEDEIQDLNIENTSKTKSSNGITSQVIELVIKNWAKHLPTKLTYKYNPKDVRVIIDDLARVITKLLKNRDLDADNKRDQLIKNEIIKFLRKYPLKSERTSELRLSKMADCLMTNLKDNTKRYAKTEVTVYEMSVNNTTDDIISIESVKGDDVKANLDAYTTQLFNEISEWLYNLNLLQNKDQDFKAVVINSLASDIIDRHIYLELNPEQRGNFEDETEQLKYQVYNWINKLADSQELDITRHVEELVTRLQSVPLPILSKYQYTSFKEGSVSVNKHSIYTSSISRVDSPTSFPNTFDSHFSEVQTHYTQNTFERKSSILDLTVLGPQDVQVYNRNMHDHSEVGQTSNQNPKEAIFEKYHRIFKRKVYDLPIDTPTPESAQLAELARTAIYNGIIKTFFRLKSDQELENDYGYFELILEDKLDEMLDLLPQTEVMKVFRRGWKQNILNTAMDMLKEMQELSDTASFKQRIKDGFNKKFTRNFEMEQCFLLQQGFLAEMAEAYILETKYKEKDRLKADTYKQRLMKKIEEMANHLTRQHNTEFRFLKKPQLIHHAIKILEGVPTPDDDVLNEEVEEILLAEEIDQWYKQLPIRPYINDFDQVFRKRMIDILAKKLHEIEKIDGDLNESKERHIKHEICKFLEDRGRLEEEQDLNIDVMVEELNNRLKNRRLKEIGENSLISVKRENTEVFNPLVDASTTTECSVHSRPHEHRLTPGHRSGFLSHIRSTHDQQRPRKYPSYTNPRPYIQAGQGVPYQWPAQQGPMIQKVQESGVVTPRINTDSNHAYKMPGYNMQSDVPLQVYVRPTSTIKRDSPTQSKSNHVGGVRLNSSKSISPHREDSKVTGFSSNQADQNMVYQNVATTRTSRVKDGRGRRIGSPRYSPQSPGSRQSYASRRRRDVSPRSISPQKSVSSKEPSKQRLQSLSPTSSIKGNIDTANENRRSWYSRRDAVNQILENDYQQNMNQGTRTRSGSVRFSPVLIEEGKSSGYSPRSSSPVTEDNLDDGNNPKITMNCKCFGKRRRSCVDSYPCPYSMGVSPYHYSEDKPGHGQTERVKTLKRPQREEFLPGRRKTWTSSCSSPSSLWAF